MTHNYESLALVISYICDNVVSINIEILHNSFMALNNLHVFHLNFKTDRNPVHPGVGYIFRSLTPIVLLSSLAWFYLLTKYEE